MYKLQNGKNGFQPATGVLRITSLAIIPLIHEPPRSVRMRHAETHDKFTGVKLIHACHRFNYASNVAWQSFEVVPNVIGPM